MLIRVSLSCDFQGVGSCDLWVSPFVGREECCFSEEVLGQEAAELNI